MTAEITVKIDIPPEVLSTIVEAAQRLIAGLFERQADPPSIREQIARTKHGKA